MGLQKTATGIGAKVAQCSLQFFTLHAQRLQLRRFDFHPVLPHLASNGRDLGHTRNGQQARAHDPVGVFAHLHGADFGRIGGQGNEQYLTHDGRDRSQLRHHARWQLLAHQVQPFADLLAVAVDVGAPLELDIDDGQTDARDRTNPGHTGHAVHAGLHRKGNQLLHLFRCHATGFGHQRNGGFVQVGEHIYRHFLHGENAVDHQQERDAQHDQALAQAGMDDEVKHISELATANRRLR